MSEEVPLVPALVLAILVQKPAALAMIEVEPANDAATHPLVADGESCLEVALFLEE